MPTYTCEKCNKAFAKKNDYTRHVENRKTDCTGKTVEQLAAEKAAAMLEVKNVESGSSALIINLVKQIHQVMYTRDAITGQKAFYDTIKLLFLRFIQPQVCPGGKLAGLLNNPKYIDIDDFEPQHAYLLVFDNLVNAITEHSSDDTYVHNTLSMVWDMLSVNDFTKNVFQKRKSFHCKTQTIGICMRMIRNTLKDVHFDDLKTDIKGEIYEHFINYYTGNGGKAFGQFFTPRNLIQRIFELNQSLFPDMQPENVYDPCTGTGGFLTEMIKNFNIDPENICGGEIEPDTYATGLMNLILATGTICNLRNHDSLTENSIQQYDWIATNPPFGVKQKYTELIERGQGKPIKIKRKSQVSMEYFDMADDMYPVKTNDGSALFLQHCICKLATGGVCNIVLPDGQLMSGKSFKALREYLIENCVLKAVLKVPSGAFEHAGVQTCVLFFRYIPGYSTEIVDFYETDKKCMSLNKVGSVNFADLPEDHNKPLTWQMYKQQFKEVPIESNWEVKTLGEICRFIPAGKRKSSEGKETGQYPLYYCSILGHLYMDSYDYEDTEVIINKTNGSGKCMIYLADGKYSIAQSVVRLKTDNPTTTRYLYYYLTSQKDKLEELYSGVNQKQISNEDLKLFNIPIPSLEKQQEIINKCKSHDQKIKLLQTNIDNNNQAKLIIKELYIDTLFNGETKKLGDICELKTGKFTTSSNNPDGKYPFYTGNAENPSHKHDEYCFDGREYLILTKDGGAGANVYGDNIGLGKTYYVCGKSAGTSHQLAIYCQSNISVKYLYYYLTSIKNNIMDLAKYTTGLGCISLESLRDIAIPVPTLEKQQEIITRFEQIDNQNNLLSETIIKVEQVKKEYLNQYFNIIRDNDGQSAL